MKFFVFIAACLVFLLGISAAAIRYSMLPCKKWEAYECGGYTECIEMNHNYRVCMKWKEVPVHECTRCVAK